MWCGVLHCVIYCMKEGCLSIASVSVSGINSLSAKNPNIFAPRRHFVQFAWPTGEQSRFNNKADRPMKNIAVI